MDFKKQHKNGLHIRSRRPSGLPQMKLIGREVKADALVERSVEIQFQGVVSGCNPADINRLEIGSGRIDGVFAATREAIGGYFHRGGSGQHSSTYDAVGLKIEADIVAARIV